MLADDEQLEQLGTGQAPQGVGGARLVQAGAERAGLWPGVDDRRLASAAAVVPGAGNHPDVGGSPSMPPLRLSGSNDTEVTADGQHAPHDHARDGPAQTGCPWPTAECQGPIASPTRIELADAHAMPLMELHAARALARVIGEGVQGKDPRLETVERGRKLQLAALRGPLRSVVGGRAK